jgi:hypothetical protein
VEWSGVQWSGVGLLRHCCPYYGDLRHLFHLRGALKPHPTLVPAYAVLPSLLLQIVGDKILKITSTCMTRVL